MNPFAIRGRSKLCGARPRLSICGFLIMSIGSRLMERTSTESQTEVIVLTWRSLVVGSRSVAIAVGEAERKSLKMAWCMVMH